MNLILDMLTLKRLRQSSGNVEEAIRCMNLELRRKTESREINLWVISI